MRSGNKCHAAALRGTPYCYLHTRVHHLAKAKPEPQNTPLKLPVLEDRSAIQLALAQILDALASARIDSKQAGRLLYGLQIASQHAEHNFHEIGTDSVVSMTQSKEGDELAPKLRICSGLDICVGCKYEETCPDFDPENEGKFGEDDDEDDEEDGEDEE